MLFLSRLSKRERYIVYISVAILACVFLDKVVFRPVLRKLEDLNRQILIQGKKLEKSMHILLQENSITGEYEKYAQHINQERSDEEEIGVLLSSIEKMAKKASVFLVDMKPSPVESWEFYKKYTIKIEAEAKISYLADFIYQLGKSPQLLRVAELRLSPKKKESSVLKIYMTVTQILII